MKKRLILSVLSGCITPLAFAEDFDDLDESIVTAQAPVSVKTIAGTADKVTAEEINRSGASNIVNALSNMPGITTTRGGGGQQSFLIRGMASEFGMILIDGQRIPNVDRNISMATKRFDVVSMEDVESIEVLRGPSSNLYGADAMSGVVNIITKKPTEVWQSKVAVRFEDVEDASGSNMTYTGITSGKIGDSLYLRVGYENKSESPIVRNGKDETFDRQINRYWMKSTYDINSTASVHFDYLRLEEDSFALDPSRDPANPTRTEDDQELNMYVLRYTDTFGDFNFQAGLNYVTNETIDDRNNVWNDNEKNFTVLLNGPIGESHYISTGLIARTEELDRENIGFDDSFDSVNLHLQDRMKLTEKTYLTLGASVDIHSRYGTEFSPKVGLNYSINDNLELKFAAGESYTAPALREASSEYRVFGGPNRFYVGNDDLQPETLRSIEAGVYYQDDAQSASFTVFFNDVDDLISTVNKTDPNDPAVTLVEYNNVNSAKINGVEASYSYAFNESTSLDFSYTFLNSEDGDGKELTNRPDHTLAAQLAHSTELLGGLDLYLSAKYVGTQINSLGGMSRFGPIPYEELPSHYVVDFAASKKLGEHFLLQIGVDNLFNDSVYENSGEVYQQGRTSWIKATATF